MIYDACGRGPVITIRVGGVRDRQNPDYVICECSLIRVPHPTSVKLAAENQYRAPYRSALAPSMITGVSFNGRWVFGDPMLLEAEIDAPKLTGSQ